MADIIKQQSITIPSGIVPHCIKSNLVLRSVRKPLSYANVLRHVFASFL